MDSHLHVFRADGQRHQPSLHQDRRREDLEADVQGNPPSLRVGAERRRHRGGARACLGDAWRHFLLRRAQIRLSQPRGRGFERDHAPRRPRRARRREGDFRARGARGSKGMKVGIVGVGIMGSAIARNLIAAGSSVIGFDLAAQRRDELSAMGGTAARSTAEVADAAEVILTSLPSVVALDETVAAILAKPRQNVILAELSTLPIEAKQRAREGLAEAGIIMLDCPLSGTGAQAVTRDLVIYASGDRAACERCAPVFAGFSRLTPSGGALGKGRRMKFLANLLVAIHNVASAEAMVLGIKGGLDPAEIVKVIGSGAGTSRIFELRAPLMAKSDYRPPTLKIGIWQKDMEVIGDFAKSLGVATPLFAASAPIYNAAVGLGLAGEDTAAVCAVLETMSGVERKLTR